jgi:hypothetical protein
MQCKIQERSLKGTFLGLIHVAVLIAFVSKDLYLF